MKANLTIITPELAKKILDEKNFGNRTMSRQHIESLANEMRRGKWKVNGDTICMNETRLIDGQHRLAAVILSGVSIKTFVIDGVPSDVFDTKDVGKRRSSGDTLGILGEKNSKRLAAALVLIDKYMTGQSDKSVTYTNTEIAELLDKYPMARNSVQTSYHTKGLIYPAVLDSCHYLFSMKDPSLADEFAEKVVLGTGLERGTPWYVLRERLVSNSLSKAKISRTYMMALCIKAWNFCRSNVKVFCLKWAEYGHNAEQFPLIK